MMLVVRRLLAAGKIARERADRAVEALERLANARGIRCQVQVVDSV
ncbi:hypothetical protein ACFRAQ_18835 [Nocardia sp. NPDC056611]